MEKLPMRHYHTLMGMEGGYLPDAIFTHTSKRNAEASMSWDIRMARDDGWRVSGSIASGHVWLERPGASSMSLREYVELITCFEDDCGEEI
jgi:hypothetical protein